MSEKSSIFAAAKMCKHMKMKKILMFCLACMGAVTR